MKRMKSVFRILLLSIPLVAFGRAQEQQVSKEIEQSFAMTNSGQLEIINKYGQVVVSQWDKDSVSFKIVITAFGKSRSEARKTLERVEIDFDETNQFLIAETIFDRSSNFFVEVWKSFSDESRALLSKSKIEINYEVFVPSGIAITLDNKYGDAYLHEMDGKLDLQIMHGNLRANNMNSNSRIQVGFGDVSIKYLRSGKLNLKASDASIMKAGNIDINSSSSELVIHEADRVRLDSRSDKRLKFDEIKSLSGKGLFSNIIVGELSGSLEMEMNYGDLRANDIAFNFSRIDIDAKSTDIELSLSKNSFMTVSIEGKEEEMFLPMIFGNLERTQTDSKKKLIRLRGKVGNENNYPAILNINSQGGDIAIRYEADASSSAKK